MPWNSFIISAVILLSLLLLTTPALRIASQSRPSDPGSAPTWMRTFGGSERDWANAIAVVPGGGFIMAGLTWSRGAGQADAWIIRLDDAGKLLWERTYGGLLWDTATAIAADSKGGFIVAGETESRGEPAADAWMIRLDEHGDVLWERTFGGGEWDRAWAVATSPRGGYYLAGWTGIWDTGTLKSWVLRLDRDGKKIWRRSVDAYGNRHANAFAAVPASATDHGGGVVLAGYRADSQNPENIDAWVLRLDTSGNTLWRRTIGGRGSDIASAITPLSGGGFLLAGKTRSGRGGDYNAWIVRLDNQGNSLWERTFGGAENEGATAISPLSGGGFALAGWTESRQAGSRAPWIMGLDAKGELLWRHPVGDQRWDTAIAIAPVREGGLIMAGGTALREDPSGDAWVMRLHGRGGVER